MTINKQKNKRLFSVRRAQNTLRRVFVLFFRRFKPKPKQEIAMLLPNVRKLMSALRERSKQVRENNKKIDEWVDQYINRCVVEGKPVTILTQWCLAKDLEVRCEKQSGFRPTKAEVNLFGLEIHKIKKLFDENSVGLRWVMTWNRSYLDLGRIDIGVEKEYIEMLSALYSTLEKEGWFECLNWEDDLLGSRPAPDKEVMEMPEKFVSQTALMLEVERHAPWAREAGLVQTAEELEADVVYKIACEAEEGKLLMDESWFFGECIILPLEAPERYDFFALKEPAVKKRIVAVLPTAPWRTG
jgi:hypothetical protein